jgi:uncharacterized protein (DUF1697 family)
VPTYVALLRGVNVGGRHRVPMADLRTLVEQLGFTGVRSHIQSGNVVFESTKAPAAEAIELALSDTFGFAVPVVVRSATEMAAVIDRNPFADCDLSKVHVGFWGTVPSASAIAACDLERFAPERFEFVRSDLYLFLPSGMARTKLPGYLERRIKVPATIRNWNTVRAIVEMSGI